MIANAQLLQEYTLRPRVELDLSSRTVVAYLGDLEQFVEILDQRHATLFTADKADTHFFVQHLAQHDIKPPSQRRKIAALRGFYKWLVQSERLEKDPMRLITLPKMPKLLPRPVAMETLEGIMQRSTQRAEAESAKPTTLRNHAMLETLYGGGVRASQLCDLREIDLQLDEHSAVVRGKGDKERVVVLGRSASDAIAQYLRFGRPQLVKRRAGRQQAVFLSVRGMRSPGFALPDCAGRGRGRAPAPTPPAPQTCSPAARISARSGAARSRHAGHHPDLHAGEQRAPARRPPQIPPERIVMPRKPKDANKYLHPILAATRLINVAMENVLWQRHGTRVRWSLKVSYFYEDSYKPGNKQKIIPGSFTMSSGEDAPEVEAALTGRQAAAVEPSANSQDEPNELPG